MFERGLLTSSAVPLRLYHFPAPPFFPSPPPRFPVLTSPHPHFPVPRLFLSPPQAMDQWELILLKAQQYIGMPVLDPTTNIGSAEETEEEYGEEEDLLPDNLLTDAEYKASAPTLRGLQEHALDSIRLFRIEI